MSEPTDKRVSQQPLPQLEERVDTIYAEIETLLADEIEEIDGTSAYEKINRLKTLLKTFQSESTRYEAACKKAGCTEEEADSRKRRHVIGRDVRSEVADLNKRLAELNLDTVSEIGSVVSRVTSQLSIEDDNHRMESIPATTDNVRRSLALLSLLHIPRFQRHYDQFCILPRSQRDLR